MNYSAGFNYVYRIDINIYLAQTNITCTWKIYFADFVIFSPSNKVWQVVVASKYAVQATKYDKLSLQINTLCNLLFSYL